MSKSERWLHYDIPRDKQSVVDPGFSWGGACYCVAMTCKGEGTGGGYPLPEGVHS